MFITFVVITAIVLTLAIIVTLWFLVLVCAIRASKAQEESDYLHQTLIDMANDGPYGRIS